jgi:hypothetical protein
LIKFYLGYYDEAAILCKDCVDYFKDERPIPYLNALNFLGLCYNKTSEYDLASKTNALGIIECSRLNVPTMKPYFIHSEGINNYFKQDYLKPFNIYKQVCPKSTPFYTIPINI